MMVQKYPDCLHYRDKKHITPFLTACGFGHVQLAEHLITEHNIPVNSQEQLVSVVIV